mmetsp:Transcript_20937/g.65563  ORF Transcript_20937/g.65563 Transcript_20937/m.65563 type:complete len:218 (-) Transcript_20937:2-655(-)
MRASGSTTTQSSDPSSRSSNFTVRWKPSPKLPMTIPGVPCRTPRFVQKMMSLLATISCHGRKPPWQTSSSSAASSSSASFFRCSNLTGANCSIAVRKAWERAGNRMGNLAVQPAGHRGMPAVWTLVLIHCRKHPLQKDFPQQPSVVGSNMRSSQIPHRNSSTTASSSGSSEDGAIACRGAVPGATAAGCPQAWCFCAKLGCRGCAAGEGAAAPVTKT